MGYLHIDNLSRNRTVLLFREVWALEKIHGSSANLSFVTRQDGLAGEAIEASGLPPTKLTFFAGGSNHLEFVKLFDEEKLLRLWKENKYPDMTIFGEVYGGKMQRMKETYGPSLKFIAFDVKIGDSWLVVPAAESICSKLGIEFVHYVKVNTDIGTLNRERDADSVQAVRNGMGSGHPREGVVLRPLVEMRMNNGERVIAKHKNAKFCETKHHKEVSAEQSEALTEANAIVEEYVTENRLKNVLSHFKPEDVCLEKIPMLIDAMHEDVVREGGFEKMASKEFRKMIGKATVKLFKQYLESQIANQ